MTDGAGASMQRRPVDASRRRLRIARALVSVVAVIALGLFTLLSSAAILTDRAFYERSLGDAHAYDRFYTQILADEQFNETTTNLVANLPLDKSLITSNLRVIIPPATLRALVGSTIGSLTQYLSGERDDIDLGVAVAPLVANVKQLVEHYLIDAIVNTESFQARNLDEFGDAVFQFFVDVSAGRTPTLLPDIPLTPEVAGGVAAIIVQNLPPGERAEAEPQIKAALAVGDLNGALALAAVDRVQIGERRAKQALTLEIGDDGEVDFTASVDAIEGTAAAELLANGRVVLGTALPIALGALLAIALGALVLVGWITGRLGERRVRRVGLLVLVAGAITAAAWGIAWLLAPDPLEPVLAASNTGMARGEKSRKLLRRT
jgi:hypothetical protein